MMNLLLDHGMDPNLILPEIDLPFLSRMISLRDAARAIILIQRGADTSRVYKGYNPPLSHVIRLALNQVVVVLLEYNANPNCVNRSGFIPLIFAVKYNNLSAMKKLIEYGADVNYGTKSGTALSLAMELTGEDDERVSILRKHSAKYDPEDDYELPRWSEYLFKVRVIALPLARIGSIVQF
jgi:ankyrin repeat protein